MTAPHACRYKLLAMGDIKRTAKRKVAKVAPVRRWAHRLPLGSIGQHTCGSSASGRLLRLQTSCELHAAHMWQAHMPLAAKGYHLTSTYTWSLQSHICRSLMQNESRGVRPACP